MIEHLGRMIVADPAGAMAFVVAFALWAYRMAHGRLWRLPR